MKKAKPLTAAARARSFLAELAVGSATMGEEKARRVVLDLQRELREVKSYLHELAAVAEEAIAAIDLEMKQPSTNERGQRIARIVHALELAKDCGKHFGLGLSLKKPMKRKPR